LVKLTALLLAALWLPATLHCQIETLGLEGFGACADHADDTTPADCTDDGCQVLESGQIVLCKTRIDFAPLPAPADASACCRLRLSPPALAPEISASRQEEMLPLQRTWQFARRAALPARAPDVLNA
jgi:hypothetical protein